MDKTGGPAFPSRGGMMFYVPEAVRGEIEQAVTALDQQHAGLSLRDYFAAKAMAAILSNDAATLRIGQAAVTNNFLPDAGVATGAYLVADAMLAERAK